MKFLFMLLALCSPLSANSLDDLVQSVIDTAESKLYQANRTGGSPLVSASMLEKIDKVGKNKFAERFILFDKLRVLDKIMMTGGDRWIEKNNSSGVRSENMFDGGFFLAFGILTDVFDVRGGSFSVTSPRGHISVLNYTFKYVSASPRGFSFSPVGTLLIRERLEYVQRAFETEQGQMDLYGITSEELSAAYKKFWKLQSLRKLSTSGFSGYCKAVFNWFAPNR